MTVTTLRCLFKVVHINILQHVTRIIWQSTCNTLKHKIYAACRMKKPKNIYFSDSVSKTRSTIMFVLRKACKDFPLVFGRYRTEDGNVRIFMPKPGENDGFEKITINTRSKLEDLLRTKANVDSSRWQVAWK